LRRLAAQRARSGDGCNAAIAQQHIHLVIDAAGRIDHAPALYEKRFHINLLRRLKPALLDKAPGTLA
jgi:hypothetical protein